MRRVVVTGRGAVSPCGNTAAASWDAVVNARSGIGRLTRFDPTGLASQIAGEVSDYTLVEAVGKKKARRVGRFMAFAMTASDEAMLDAGYNLEEGLMPTSETFACYIGSGIGGFPEIVAGAEECVKTGAGRVSPLFIPKALNNLAAGQVAIRHKCRGPSLCISTACAVGNHAIGEAFRAIRDGMADTALAGGAEAALCPLGYGGFMNMRALSRRNDDPTKASRPFDAERDGFVMSEGAGVLFLEELEHAKARGATIYAEVVGYGATTDAHHITSPSPGGDGAIRCMKMAMKFAGWSPDSVDYINAHGTSTPANDSTETEAIRTTFQDHADSLLVSSTKGATGHLLGAAGGLEAVFTVNALSTGIVPPTANLENPDPACDLDYVANEARRVPIKRALSNGFGFGGTNAVLAFARWDGA